MFCESAYTSQSVPPVAGKLARRILIEKELNREKKLALLCAPAGFGKTLTLATWLQHTKKKSVWLSLDDSLNCEESFNVAFARSLSLAGYGEPFLSDLSVSSNVLLNIVKAISNEELVLVFDGLDAITHPGVRQTVASILMVNKGLSILVARSESTISELFSFQQEDPTTQATWIRAEQLAFSFQEAWWVAQAVGDSEESIKKSLHEKFLARFWNETEGWPHFFTQYLQTASKTPHVNNVLMKKTDVKRYVSEMFYSALREPEKKLLKDMSSFDRFDVNLCHACSSTRNSLMVIKSLLTSLCKNYGLLLEDAPGIYRMRKVVKTYVADLVKEKSAGLSAISADLSVLSKREMQILRLMSTGISNSAIANELSRSIGTVKVHVHNIYQKLEVVNRVTAIGKFNAYTMAEC